MKQQLKDEMDDVQDVLNSYASNLYGNMKDTMYDTGESCQIIYDAGINDLAGPYREQQFCSSAILTVLRLGIQDTEDYFHSEWKV